MGAGKSTIGRELAARSGRTFADTDLLLQARFGRSLPRVFDLYGEVTFRDHETSILKSLEPANQVLATGGGIVQNPENWTEMQRLGTTVYMNVAPEILKMRLEKSKRPRPLLMVENWHERFDDLFYRRQPMYMQADVVVELCEETPAETCAKLLEAIGDSE